MWEFEEVERMKRVEDTMTWDWIPDLARSGPFLVTWPRLVMPLLGLFLSPCNLQTTKYVIIKIILIIIKYCITILLFIIY